MRPARSRVLRRLRWVELGVVILVLFWLPVEDVQTGWALLLAAVGCALIVLHLVARRQNSRPLRFIASVWLGALTGGCVPFGAVLLMIFKSGVHGHVVPDFSIAQVLEVLARLPAWILGGALIGLGSGLYRWSNQEKLNLETGDAD